MKIFLTLVKRRTVILIVAGLVVTAVLGVAVPHRHRECQVEIGSKNPHANTGQQATGNSEISGAAGLLHNNVCAGADEGR